MNNIFYHYYFFDNIFFYYYLLYNNISSLTNFDFNEISGNNSQDLIDINQIQLDCLSRQTYLINKLNLHYLECEYPKHDQYQCIKLFNEIGEFHKDCILNNNLYKDSILSNND